MSFYHYHHRKLYCEEISLEDLIKTYGTPLYVYSQTALMTNVEKFKNSFKNTPHQICYAVKANSNLALLQLFALQQLGFDIVSIGELERVLIAGGDPAKMIYSGVGKQTHEIKRALEVGIGCFNVESMSELKRIQKVAEQCNQIASIALRINPNINAETHPYIATGLAHNKFGMDIQTVLKLIPQVKSLSYIKLIGMACHIGSQLTSLSSISEAIDILIQLMEKLKREEIILEHLNVGGGLGVQYHEETPPSIEDYVSLLKEKLNPFHLKIMIEPGRVLVANSGVLLTSVEYIKTTQNKNFIVVDAAMNDLLRPSFYNAWHHILPLQQATLENKVYDIVGPICESSDFFAKDRTLSQVNEGDYLAICTAGAYGFSMASQYNSRVRPAEVLVNKNQAYLIRLRESLSMLWENERLVL